jgi:bacterioferritin-associated ferredoxin
MITDRDVRASLKPCGAPAERARDIFASCGCMPKCGRCVRNIQTLCDREGAGKAEGLTLALSRMPELAIAAE